MQLIGLAVVLTLSLVLAPLAGQAQPAKNIRLGYLSLGSPETSGLKAVRQAFVQGLQDLGYTERHNIAIEYRYSGGVRDRLSALAEELVRLQPDVLVGEGFETAEALKRATSSIPIVVVACDVVAGGLAASLARPGGNLTGLTCITAELGAKRLELLSEVVPNISRIGVLWNPADMAKRLELDGMSLGAKARGVTVQPLDFKLHEDLERAFAVARRERLGALLVLGDAFTIIHRGRIAELAAASRLPAMYSFREFVDAGGLMSYGPNGLDLFRRLASYVDKIVKGARPMDLPLEQPTKFELVINLKTAKALGLTIPQTLLLRADQVIQ